MSTTTSSHAYGIGVIALILGMSASILFYTSFYLPESLEKPSVDIHILEPTENFIINIVEGAALEGNDNYVPNNPKITLTVDNHVIWMNDDVTPHTVTPDHRHSDSYSGEFGSTGVVMPGDSYEFIFTEPQELYYHCDPHPWMTGSLIVEKSRF
jgi:plastocyanin